MSFKSILLTAVIAIVSVGLWKNYAPDAIKVGPLSF